MALTIYGARHLAGSGQLKIQLARSPSSFFQRGINLLIKAKITLNRSNHFGVWLRSALATPRRHMSKPSSQSEYPQWAGTEKLGRQTNVCLAQIPKEPTRTATHGVGSWGGKCKRKQINYQPLLSKQASWSLLLCSFLC